jgi:hemin uptake protein HemP
MTVGQEGAVAKNPGQEPPSLPAIESRTLLAGHREVLIRHGEDTYRLKLTSNNKLILMK